MDDQSISFQRNLEKNMDFHFFGQTNILDNFGVLGMALHQEPTSSFKTFNNIQNQQLLSTKQNIVFMLYVLFLGSKSGKDSTSTLSLLIHRVRLKTRKKVH
jgi:hypothetical protein